MNRPILPIRNSSECRASCNSKSVKSCLLYWAPPLWNYLPSIWEVDSCLSARSWCGLLFVGFCLSTPFLRIDHRFSMGLRSGPRIQNVNVMISEPLHYGAPSCWEMDHDQIAPGLLGEVALWGRYNSVLDSWQCFWTELWVSPLPWMWSNLTHRWSQDAPLLARHRTHGSVHLFYFGQSIFQMSQTVRRGLHQRK